MANLDTYQIMQQQLMQAYSDLLIVQYHGLPKATATIQMHIKVLSANMLLWKIRDAFDVDTSVGTQLEILGKWVGVDKFFRGQSFTDDFYLAFFDENDLTQPNFNQGGLRNENNIRNEDGYLLTYDDVKSVTNALSDEDYRWLIKLKIIKNNYVMTCKNIDDAINNLFGSEVYTTWNNIPVPFLAFFDENLEDEPTINQLGLRNENIIRTTDGALLTYDDIPDVMTITYNYVKNRSAIIELGKEKNCLPVPTGCKIKLQEIS